MADLVSKPFLPRLLTADAVVRAYREGFFPMACGDGRLRWFSPDPRGIIPPDKFHLPRGFRRVRRRLGFRVSVDTAFDDVVAGCADRAETWIDASIARVYAQLHGQGLAHSVEVWAGERLVGGLYGVRLGGAFFGESMFSRASEASKLALAVLMQTLRELGFGLLDIQWVTDHLAGFGAVEVERSVYLRLLRRAIGRERSFPPAGPVEAGVTGAMSLRRRQTA